MFNAYAKSNSRVMDHPYQTYGEALTLLAELPNAGSTPIDLEKILEENIKNAAEKLSIKDLTQLSSLERFGVNVGCDDVRWKWVALAIHILLLMKEYDEDCLLSIRQEKAVRTTLEFIVSLGLLPCLLPGVGVPIAKRCSSTTAEWVLQGSLLDENNPVPVIELHKRLAAITRILLSCIKNEHLRGLILSRHLCDLLAALCQLSAAPLKKPKPSNERSVVELEQCNPSSPYACKLAKDERIFGKKKKEIDQRVLVSEIHEANALTMDHINKTTEFQMTAELWELLQDEKKAFSRDLENLVSEIHQPLVIRDLLLLQGSPEKPGGIGVKMAPMWLRRACASLLNSCLFRKGGVMATVHAICDAFSLPNHSKTDAWAQHIALGRIIAMAARARKGDADWFEEVCSQVMDLLSPKNIKDDTDYARAGVVCLSLLLEAEKEICMKCILEPIMAPLTTSQSPNSPASDKESIHAAKDCSPGIENYNSLEDCGKRSDSVSLIESSLAIIDFCFVENDPRVPLPTSILSPLFSPLLREYRDKRLGDHCLSFVSRILLKFINNCSEELILSESLKSVLFEGSFGDLKSMAERAESPEVPNTLKGLGLDEEKYLKVLVNKDVEKLGKAVQEIGEMNELGWGSGPLLELVSTDESAACILFHYVLQVFPKGVEEGEGSPMASIAKQSVATQLLCHLLEVPSVSGQIRKDPRDVVNFLGDFLAKEAHKVFNAGTDVVDGSLLDSSSEGVFPSLLDLGLNPIDLRASMEEEGRSSEQSHSEFVMVALLILKSVCEVSRVENNQERWSPLRKILPQVRVFRRNSSCSEVRAMAEDVACAILTQGNKAQVGGIEKAVSFVTSGREGVNSYAAMNCEEKGRGSEFEKALRMAQEDEVSLRGHALIALKRLLSSKDQVAMRNQTTLLQVFQENLKHTDSYVYLAAIDGLEKLGLIFPDQVLESLADEFAEIGVVQMGNADFNGARLKVGEALLRVTRTLGDMAPKFSCLLLNAFLGGVRDSDGMVRASSLSNLGEVCKILSFRLGPIVTEVLWCVRCVLETDCAVEARRAAVLVLHLLLQGLGVQMFKILETALPELYRTLKSVKCNDPDEVVRFHAQLTLEEVDRITLQFLFPPQKLEKKIFVLDPPS